jgi:ribosomal protein S18 acetylase RimI-like enzyme
MHQLALRNALPADQPWLAALYADVRHYEVMAFGWNAAAAHAFLMQQFDLQQRGYRSSHPAAHCQIIESVDASAEGERRIGRLWIDDQPDQVCVLDISLRSGWRGRGLGGHLLRQAMTEAAVAGKALVLHVEQSNPARRLYERLGFAVTEHQPPYLAMQWRTTDAGSSLRAEVCNEQA